MGVTALVTIVAVESDLAGLSNIPLLLVASAYLGLIAVSTLYQLWSRRCVLLERLFD